ncbi:MAG: hypothetical protein ACRD1A_06630 [Terriglobales bacterium]
MSAPAPTALDWAGFEPIATTVLYEGQLLYPYRRSALKNQQQWNFGTLHPAGTGWERSGFRLEILVERSGAPEVALQLCFLDRGHERRGEASGSGTHEFAWGDVQATVTVTLAGLEPGLWQVGVEVANSSSSALMTAAHLRCLLAGGGAFVSAQNPSPELEGQAGRCRCEGIFPVLIGQPGERHRLLAAAIILEDYPQVAPQSLGDFCDAAEMDELLTLRVLTLSAAEKDEIRRAGGVGAAILERCTTAQGMNLAGLHGGRTDAAVKPGGFDPFAPPAASAQVAGVEVRAGTRVRLHPRPGGDLFNRLLDGRGGAIQAVEQDLEGNFLFAVVADDDPGRDLGELRQTGHRFFFTSDEIEPL